MRIAVHFKNEAIAKKVLWLLDHFKNEGVDVIKLDTEDAEVIRHFREGLKEVEQIKEEKISSRSIEEFLHEL